MSSRFDGKKYVYGGDDVIRENAELCCTPEYEIEMERRLNRLMVNNLATGETMPAKEYLKRKSNEEPQA